MPGGALSQIYGPKKTWYWFMGTAALTAMLIPIAAHVGGPAYGMWLVGALNFVSGLGQGPLYPGSSGLFAAWLPSGEAALYIAIVYAMWSGGQGISNALQPAIMTNLGWEWCYFMFGGFVLIWCFFWNKYGYDRPADDPLCSGELQHSPLLYHHQ